MNPSSESRSSGSGDGIGETSSCTAQNSEISTRNQTASTIETNTNNSQKIIIAGDQTSNLF